MAIAVHVTHEAVQKIGGIGTVLHGLILAKNYQSMFPRTLLYSPLFYRDGDPARRLGDDSEILYSGLDNYDGGNFHARFLEIENKYGAHIIYGKKGFKEGRSKKETIDIVAVDIWDIKAEAVNNFKFKLWEYFKIASDRYQSDRDYEQYLRIGIVLRDIFEALYGQEERAIVFSHEYMGMPSALAFLIDKTEGRRKGDTTILYAHEVSTARRIVEGHPGHDLAFYNIMRTDREKGVSLEEEFGSYSSYSRNELTKRATLLDFIFAVSDLTKEELLYLCPGANEDKIKVPYNGIPVEKVSYSDKKEGIRIIGDYCENLFNFRPDYVFTHVARLVISKAMWRDIRFLYHLDEHFAKNNIKGFFVLLSSLIGDGRPDDIVRKMEADYGWPVVHHEGWPDLMGAELDIYRYLELFNARSKAIKGVLLNQFGFDHKHCGERMPKEATLLHLRLASDVEFGMSIYEPFGIAQLETLPYGGLPLLSDACGCVGLLHGTTDTDDYLSIDFTTTPPAFRDILKTKDDFAKITKELRDVIETEICMASAPHISAKLPKTERERKSRFNKMQKKSALLDWEHVAARIKEYL